jgi:prephenate dehydrogenase
MHHGGTPAPGGIGLMAAASGGKWRPERITVVGLGLLGASIAEAARRRWNDLGITGVSSPGTLEKATEAGLIDDAFMYPEIDSAVAGSDIVILCTPIDNIKSVLQGWASHPPSAKDGCIITDVGSTKAEICALGRRAFPETSPLFIGSHPMAGSEKTGLDARDPLLFENASWVLCPAADAPEEAVERLQIFVEALGARSTRMPPELHDTVAAHVSHLPQLLSTALAGFIGSHTQVVENCLQIAGGGFRDMTRLAASSFPVWDPILRTNKKAIREVTAAFQQHLSHLSDSLEREGGAGEFFKEASRLRGKLSTSKKGFTAALTEILVDLEDRPGVLLRALIPLAERGINVQDLEILKVREGEAGVLMMAFRRPEDAQMALGALAGEGFQGRFR